MPSLLHTYSRSFIRFEYEERDGVAYISELEVLTSPRIFPENSAEKSLFHILLNTIFTVDPIV